MPCQPTPASALARALRSSTMSEDSKRELEKYVFEKGYAIITFDELFERARTLLENMGIRYGAFGASI